MACRDQPKPGKGYLVLLSVLAVGTVALVAAFIVSTRNESRSELAAVLLIFALPLLVLIVIPLHAAFRTRYELRGDVLRLRAGIVIRASLSYEQIATVEPVSFISRVLGWGGGRGLANRLTDGLRITLHSGAVYFISPSDPERFAAEIRNRIGAGLAVTKPTPPTGSSAAPDR